AIDNGIGSTAASNTININNNVIYVGYQTATTGIYTAINNSATAATVNINNNTITKIAGVDLGGTGTHVMIETGSPTNANAKNNVIQNLTRNGGSGSWRIIKTTSPQSLVVDGNLIENIGWTNTSSTGSIDAFYSFSSAVNVAVTNNTIRNLYIPTTGTINGIREYGVAGNKIIQNNQVYNFYTTTGGAGGATFNGIFCSVGTIEISNNQVYNLNSTGTTGGTSGTVYGINISIATPSLVNIFRNNIYNLSTLSSNPTVGGIYIANGTTVNIYNNFISDLKATQANAANAVIGLNITGGTTVNAYYNTIYLNTTSSAALFGSSGISASTTPTLDLRNNIVVNTSQAKGTGFTVAYRRNATTLTSYANTSNNNDFFAGTPGPSNLIFYDGTNADQTINAFQTRVAPRDNVSFSVMPPFVNITTPPFDLHIQTTVPTMIESSGQKITTPAITTDIDNDIRWGETGYTGSGTATDIGADEFEGTAAYTCTTPAPGNTLSSITPPICFGQSVTLTIQNVPSGTGVQYQWQSSTDGTTYNNISGATASSYNVTPNAPIYYRCMVTCLNGPETAYSTPVYINFATEITSTTPGVRCGTGSVTLQATGTGNAIQWFNAPTGGTLLGTGSPFNTPSISSTTTFYAQANNILLSPGYVQAGTQTNVSTAAAQTPFSTNWKDGKHQYLFLASELSAMNLMPGNITDLAFNIVSLGSPAMTNFKILMGQTTNNSLTTSYITGLTEVFSNSSFTFSATGWQTITLTTPFNWDGVSNIVIQICYGNNSTFSTSTHIQYTNTSFNSHIYGYQDNGTGCAMTTPTNFGVNVNRINTRFYGTTMQQCPSARVPVVATVNAAAPLTISPNQTVCNNAVATIQVTSNLADFDEYLWSPATGLFTDAACTVPYVSGTSATTVYAKTNVAGSVTYTCTANNTSTQCSNVATTTVVTLPATVSITASPNDFCQSGSSLLSVSPNTGWGTATFQWAQSADGVNYTDIIGATGLTYNTPVINQSTYYQFTAYAGSSVCLQQNVLVNVNNPTILTTTNGSRCGTGTVQLGATASTNAQVVWYDALTGFNVLGTGTTFTTPVINQTTTYYAAAELQTNVNGQIGTGTTANSSTGYPAVYGNYYESSKHQMLILASELTAAGFKAGLLKSITFNVTNLNGAGIHKAFTIRIAPTNITALTNTFESTGFVSVYGPVDYQPVVGANTHVFTTPFVWDGVSNIIVETCFSNDPTGSGTFYTYNASTTFTNTGFNSTTFRYADNTDACPTTTSATVSQNRPNMLINGVNICAGPRVPVTANITSSTPITITDDVTVCNNETVLLEVTSGASNYDQITWTPAANLFTDAACTVPYTSGTHATQVYFKTTTAGNHAYICNAYNTVTECATTDNVTITVLPSSVTLTATPSKICLSGSSTISVNPSSGWSTAMLQWYESTDGINWTAISGANGISLTTPVINSTTQYKFTASIGANTCVQNTVTIEVTSPVIAGVTHGNICGSGSVVLSATPSNPTTSILWYNQATGGYPIASGQNYTTPVLTGPASYYAEPYEVLSTFNVGKLNDPSAALTPFTGYGMYFATTNAVIINSVEIYPSTAGTLNVYLVNNLTQVVDARAFTITSADISNTTKKQLVLNFFVPANTTGWMLYYDNLNIYRGAGTYSYPYTNQGFSITGNTVNGNNITGGTRMYFYNWQVTSLCTGVREPVNVNYATPDPVNIVASANNVCAGTSITLQAQSNNSNYTYTWSNNQTGNSIVVSPSTTSNYAVTASDSQTGCVAFNDINLNIYPAPVATATATPNTITCGQTVQLNAGNMYTPEVLLESFNGTTHSFTTVNTSTGGNAAAAAWTVRPSGYVYGGTTFQSPDNSKFILSNSDEQGNGGTTHTELISDVFSSVGVDTMTIQFQHYYRHYTGSSIKVEIFDGTQWTTLQTWTTTQGAANNFANATVPVPNTYLNNPNLKVRFVYDASWGYYWAIDNAKMNLFKANTFSWTSQPLGFTSTLSNPTDVPSATTQYTVTVTSYQGCTNTANITVTVNSLPAPTVTVNNSCDQSTLTASNYTGTLNWSTGETTPSIIVNNANPVTVTYTSGNCTSNAATVNPAPIQTPNAPIVNDVHACMGETIDPFVATSNYNQFNWYSDAQLSNQIGTGSTYQSTETNPGTYTYYVVAINNGCVSAPTAATLTIHSLPTAAITQNGDTLFSSSPSGNQWYNSQGPIAGATNNYYVVAVEDDYFVVVTDVNGCSAMSNILHVIPTALAQQEWNNMITVNPNPAHSYTVVSLGKLNNATIQIVTMDGRVVSESFATNSKYTLSLKGLPSGIYNVRIITNERTVNKKLIVE
ncbi:MAG: T9SS type A sorting domain-containing protein, partial [Bacteroidales bacterium]|nr:T9SS type A sorting domain-containing protein [Bacteroidales bacterium]